MCLDFARHERGWVRSLIQRRQPFRLIFRRQRIDQFAQPRPFGGATWRYTIPGHGQIRWRKILDLLQQAAYQGAITIELEDANFNGTEPGEKQGILAAAQCLATC